MFGSLCFFCALCGAIFCECVSKFVFFSVLFLVFFCGYVCAFLFVFFSMGFLCFFSGNHVWLFVFFFAFCGALFCACVW